MFSTPKRVSLVPAAGVLAVVAVAGLAGPAAAAPLTPAGAGLAAVTPAASKPNVTISGTPAAWHPRTVRVAAKTFTKCTTAKETWTITNRTKKSETIQFKKGSSKKYTLGALPADSKAGVCSKGSAGTVYTFYIKGAKSTLKVTIK